MRIKKYSFPKNISKPFSIIYKTDFNDTFFAQTIISMDKRNKPLLRLLSTHPKQKTSKFYQITHKTEILY